MVEFVEQQKKLTVELGLGRPGSGLFNCVAQGGEHGHDGISPVSPGRSWRKLCHRDHALGLDAGHDEISSQRDRLVHSVEVPAESDHPREAACALPKGCTEALVTNGHEHLLRRDSACIGVGQVKTEFIKRPLVASEPLTDPLRRV